MTFMHCFDSFGGLCGIEPRSPAIAAQRTLLTAKAKVNRQAQF